jgi:hypothetical protein
MNENKFWQITELKILNHEDFRDRLTPNTSTPTAKKMGLQ